MHLKENIFIKLINNNHKEFKNSLWIFSEKIGKILLYFVIGIFLARYLGAENFGLYSSILSIIVISSSIAAFGLNGILVKELIVKKHSDNVIATAIVARFFGIVMASLVSITVAYYLLNQYTDKYLLFIISIAISFSLVQIIDIFFESQLKSSIIAKYRLIGYLIGSLTKVFLLVNDYNYYYLLIAHFFELFVIFFLALISFSKYKNLSNIYLNIKCVDKTYLFHLMKKGLPLMLSGIAVLLYMKIDQFFILKYLDATNVGLYTSATRLCEGLFLFSAIIITSFFPRLINYKTNSLHNYNKLLIILARSLILFGSLIAFIIITFNDEIINLLYGAEYIKSATVLAIYAGSLPIVYFGDVLSRWLIIEDLTHYSLNRHLLGLVMNIILNILLIPKYGIEGAAIASVVAYFSAVILFSLTISKGRNLIKLIIKGV